MSCCPRYTDTVDTDVSDVWTLLLFCLRATELLNTQSFLQTLNLFPCLLACTNTQQRKPLGFVSVHNVLNVHALYLLDVSTQSEINMTAGKPLLFRHPRHPTTHSYTTTTHTARDAGRWRNAVNFAVA